MIAKFLCRLFKCETSQEARIKSLEDRLKKLEDYVAEGPRYG